MTYVAVPKEIDSRNVVSKGYSFSSKQYEKVVCKNSNTISVRDFLLRDLSNNDLGSEIGSANYIYKSPFKFIRTKALQDHSFLPEISEETIVPMMPREFIQMNLQEGDILISKDSNIGEAVILDKDYPEYMISGAIYRLPIKERKYYLLAFIKHDFFRQQLDLLVPKGATIRHAKTLFLDCFIPIPNHDEEYVIKYVELLTISIINKEKEIRKKHAIIQNDILNELKSNQLTRQFTFDYPSIDEVRSIGRLDTSRYTKEYKEFEFLISNYIHGKSNLSELGYSVLRGQNLQETAIGKSYYSDKYVKGFYKLAVSSNFSEYSTLQKFIYLGNERKLKSIEKDDIIFSCRGAQFGRVVMFPYEINAITNIDNVHIKNNNARLSEKVFITMFLNLLRWNKHIYKIALTGSGANSLTKYQFNEINFPNFPEQIQGRIAAFYHSPEIKMNTNNLNVSNFLERDKEFEQKAGVVQLDIQLKKVKDRLNDVIDSIINDRKVTVDFEFLDNNI